MKHSFHHCRAFKSWKSLYFSGVILFIAGAILAIPCLTFAQQTSGGIVGIVTDPTGAVVPNAKVTATNTQQGTTWTTQTNSTGSYNFPRLPAGKYTVKVQAKGFATAQRHAFTLQMNQVARVNMSLKVGEETETVSVSGAPPLLKTQTSDVGLVTSHNFNVNLPLASRNFVELTTLTPGVTQPAQGAFNGAGTIGSDRPNINGNRQQDNNFQLSGIGANEIANNELEYQPSTDAIQEFNVITNNASAQYGQYQGGIISVSLKSGSNHYHGDLYEYYRNAKLDANSWANDWQGLPKAGYNYNMFGATLGGPIMKNKLFFFVDYQGVRDDNPPSTSYWTTMTPQERNGNFSQLLQVSADNPTPRQLYNPCASFSGPCTPPASPGTTPMQPFTNDIIPPSMISPVAKALFASGLYPEPSNGNLLNNAFNTSHSYLNRDQGDVRIDYMLNNRNHIWGSYSQSFQTNPTTNSTPLYPTNYSNNPFHLGSVHWTYTMSPTVVMDATLGINRTFWDTGSVVPNVGNLAQKLGIADGNIHGPGLPYLGIGGNGFASGIGTDGINQLFATTSIDPSVAFIMTRGHHMIHVGFQAMRHRINTFYSGNNGQWGYLHYNGQYTGIGEADFFLGLPYSIGIGTNGGTWGQRSWVLAPYIEDDWQFTPHLTLNLGLRWQYNQPWYEVYNRQSNFGLISGKLELAGQNGNGRALYNQYWNDWEPRIGFAYNPGFWGGSTVIRGGFGISSFLEGTGTNLRLPMNPPFQRESVADYTTGTQLYYPGSTTSQGFSTLSAPSNPYAGANIRLWNPAIQPAISEQWNLGIQRQFGFQTVVSLAYVGQHGTNLMVPMDYFQRRLPGTSGCPASASAPCPSLYLSGNPTLYNSIGGIVGTASTGGQNYNSLQASLTKHMTHGLELQLSYTYSKAMTNALGFYGFGGQVSTNSAYWQNVYNGQAEWGPAGFNNSQNFTAAYVYHLPFGRGEKFGSHLNPMLNSVLGGWMVSGMFTARSGFPSTVTANDASGTDSKGARAACIAPVNTLGGVGLGTTWFSTSSFAQPTAGTFGNCGVGTVYGPGMLDWDAGFMKNFRIGNSETRRFQFRAEFTNFTNTPEFNAPNMSVSSSQFGIITGAGNPRIIQLAGKLYF